MAHCFQTRYSDQVVQAREQVVVVTGASRGIGAATARLAGAQGYSVAVGYETSTSKAEAVVASIRAGGAKAVSIRADISNFTEVQRFFDTVDRELGPVTALVNNAGIPGERNSFADFNEESLRRVIDINVVGYLFCAREAVRRMSTERGGSGGAIVNVSSLAAITGGNRLSCYATSKAAVNGLTLGLARETASEGIRVNAVAPGVISTDQHDLTDQEKVSRMNAGIPMARIGRPEEVAEVILWLLSGRSSYVTGAIVPVSGGR